MLFVCTFGNSLCIGSLCGRSAFHQDINSLPCLIYDTSLKLMVVCRVIYLNSNVIPEIIKLSVLKSSYSVSLSFASLFINIIIDISFMLSALKFKS